MTAIRSLRSSASIATGDLALRFSVSVVTTGLALTAAVGCASNNDPPPVRAPLTSITDARARILAPLLTIRKADLPEFKVRARAAQGEPEDSRFARCARQSRTTPRSQAKIAARDRAGRGKTWTQRPWASARSERLSANSGYQTLLAGSEVSIMSTAAAARSEIVAEKNIDLACLEHVLRTKSAKKHGRSSVRDVTIERLSMTVKGADASAAYRLVAAYKGLPLVGYVDSIVFSYGQDAFTLTTFHASKPVPPAMDERLLGLLVARAKSHSR